MTERPYKDIGERLKKARIAKGFATAADASRAYGWPASTYNSHELGTRKPRPEQFEDYARRFNVSRFLLEFGEAIEKSAPPAKSGRVRFAGLIGAGQQVIPDPDFHEEISLMLDGDVAEAFEVRGDSMQPVARDGDILFFGRPRNPKSLIGRECIVETENGARYFKTLAYGSQPGLFTLVSYNAPQIIDIVVVKAGELLAIRRR